MVDKRDYRGYRIGERKLYKADRHRPEAKEQRYQALREVTHQRKREYMKLLGNACADCGFTGHSASFDFHHRDASKKEFQIASRLLCDPKAVRRELKKCILLCANCHRVRHAKYQD